MKKKRMIAFNCFRNFYYVSEYSEDGETFTSGSEDWDVDVEGQNFFLNIRFNGSDGDFDNMDRYKYTNGNWEYCENWELV